MDSLRILLGISADDSATIEKLNVIKSLTESRLAILLGGVSEIPEELEYIVTEVSIIRFNKIGSEGASSHTVEGESISFNDDDFAGFRDEIQAYLNNQESNKIGKVRFL